jgi:CheY-like chemotaxis protein
VAVKKRLLWIDDDDPERYLFETLTLEEVGWNVAWVQPVEEPQRMSLLAAARKLAAEAFDAVLLDQVFPIQESDSRTLWIDGEFPRDQDIWSGCRLLYWLRGEAAPDDAPLSDDAQEIYNYKPLEANRDLPVCVVSAYFNEEVERAIVAASEKDARLKIIRKPIRTAELLGFFRHFFQNGCSSEES